jgi:prepilin-type N-terminal cleavage/methylation domain-containing protein
VQGNGRGARARRSVRYYSGRGFSLIELLLVIVILGIVAALAVPMAGSNEATRLHSAVLLLMADIEFAQGESIAHPEDPRVLRIDPANARYWVASGSVPDTPVPDPGGGTTLEVTFGLGRGSGLNGVGISAASLGGTTQLNFDSLGLPVTTTDATITLTSGVHSRTVVVGAESGEVTLQ